MVGSDRRKGDDRRQLGRMEIFWRHTPVSEGEAACNATTVVLSDNNGVVLSYSKEAFESIVESYERLRKR